MTPEDHLMKQIHDGFSRVLEDLGFRHKESQVGGCFATIEGELAGRTVEIEILSFPEPPLLRDGEERLYDKRLNAYTAEGREVRAHRDDPPTAPGPDELVLPF